jgi:hypothetical protein
MMNQEKIRAGLKKVPNGNVDLPQVNGTNMNSNYNYSHTSRSINNGQILATYCN